MTDPSQGKKKRRITIIASPKGVEIAGKALLRLGFHSKSNFAKSQFLARSTVTKFFQCQPIQVDSFEKICEALQLNWREIAGIAEEEQSELLERNDCPMLETNEGGEPVQTLGRKIIVKDRKNNTIKAEIILEGDINSINNDLSICLELFLQQDSGNTIRITKITGGSIRLIIEGSQEDIKRLVSRIKSRELTEISGFPIEDIIVDDKWRLVEEIASRGAVDRDLSGADLSDADLSGAKLSGADLSGADLSGADLSGADLSGADLSGAELSGAELSGADLRNTRISEETKLDDKWRLVQEIVTQEAVGRNLRGAKSKPNIKMKLNSQVISQIWVLIKKKMAYQKNSNTNLNGPGFYTILGIIFSLFGWFLSKFILYIGGNDFPFEIPSYAIRLVIITPCLICAMVMAEIFVSNPTRHKYNRRVFICSYLIPVFITGVIAGIFLSILNMTLLASDWSSAKVRLVSWMIIGLLAGIADGLTWSFRSIEGTSKKRRQRLIKSTLLGGGAGIVAANLCEIVRQPAGIYQEPIGFFILGSCLGLALSFSARQSYLFALRAGSGFEYIDFGNKLQPERPKLQSQNNNLKFIPDSNERYIEEGVSIQLPTNTSQPIQIQIGSSEEADIYIPDLPETCAILTVKSSQVTIKCMAEKSVKIQTMMMVKKETIILRHNQLITLYPKKNNYKKFYRFVFYNRFLDPQALM